MSDFGWVIASPLFVYLVSRALCLKTVWPGVVLSALLSLLAFLRLRR